MPLPVIVALWLALALVVFFAARAAIGYQTVTVREHQRGLLFRSGRIARVLEPGRYPLWGRNVAVELMDMRSRVLVISGQEVLTADSVSVRASMLVRYRIVDPQRAFTTAEDYERALHAESQMLLRRLIGAVEMEQLMEQREPIAVQLGEGLSAPAAAVGLAIESAGLRDLTFPPALRQALQQVVEARKAAQATLERARGEMATLRSLANAARVLAANPGVATLRAIQGGEHGRHTLVLNLGGAQGGATTTPVPEDGTEGPAEG